jgi:NAD(P)H-flavin reductase/ferredoxin
MPRIYIAESGYDLSPGETLLDGLARHGIEIPSSCRAGVCQTCMVRAESGSVPAAAQAGLSPPLRAQNYLLSCRCTPEEDLRIAIESGAREYETYIQASSRLSERITALHLACPEDFQYWPGQFINLIRPGNIVRSYSLASVPGEDDGLLLHVALMPGGKLSRWVHDEAAPGDALRFSGPHGACFYVPGKPEQPLLLAGTGTGLAPLFGIARDALRQGHTAPIHLFHGAVNEQGLYLHAPLRALEARHKNFHYSPCVLETPSHPDTVQADLVAHVSATRGSLKGWRVFLCGPPELTGQLQRRCFLAGAALHDILANAFLPAASAAS